MSLAKGAAYAGHYIIISLSLRDEKERAYGFLGEEMVWLCCVGRGTAQLYVEGQERAYGFLGEEMVCLCCVGRGTA
jgi:hypothetical protein